MIAYVAMIPIIRENGPRASNIAFIYIVIYFSSIPHFLALASSILNKDKTVEELRSSYDPFFDTLFLISFIVFIVLLVLVIIQVLYFVKRSYSDFQRVIPPSYYKSSQNVMIKDNGEVDFISYRPIHESEEPFMFKNYLNLLAVERPNQYEVSSFETPEIFDK